MHAIESTHYKGSQTHIKDKHCTKIHMTVQLWRNQKSLRAKATRVTIVVHLRILVQLDCQGSALQIEVMEVIDCQLSHFGSSKSHSAVALHKHFHFNHASYSKRRAW